MKLNIDQLIDIRKAPIWVRFLLVFMKSRRYEMPGFDYIVEYKTLFTKTYFIRAYILPGQHQEKK